MPTRQVDLPQAATHPLEELEMPIDTRTRQDGPVVRLTTANLAKENRSLRNVNASIVRALTLSDAVLFQEAETVLIRAALSAQARRLGFNVFWPGSVPLEPGLKWKAGAPANAVPIALRASRFSKPIAWDTAKLIDGERGRFPDRYHPVVTVRDLKGPVNSRGQHVKTRFWNTHLPRGVYHSQWEHCMDQLDAFGRGWDDPTDQPMFGGMDSNGYKPRVEGFHTWTDDRGTHGSSFYDCLYTAHARLDGHPDEAIGQLDLPGSDHNALRAFLVPRYLV